MKNQVRNRKVVVQVIVLLFLLYNIDVISYAHDDSPAHFHDDSTARSVEEGLIANTDVGEPVSAHGVGDNDRYVLQGTDAACFTIGSETGQLKTTKVFDYDTKSSYSVTVVIERGTISQFSDQFTGPIIEYLSSDSISVTIDVTDVSWHFIDGNSTTLAVDEELVVTSVHGREFGSPIPAEYGKHRRFSIEHSGDDWSKFGIDAKTGQLSILQPLDYESQSSYTFKVVLERQAVLNLVYNIQVPLWHVVEDTIIVTVNVNDVNERPVFHSSAVVLSVEDTTAIGTNVGSPVSATDPEGDTLTYSLGGIDAVSFFIDSDTGQLQNRVALNHNTKSSYSVEVTATDGELSTSINVSIEVLSDGAVSQVQVSTADTAPSFSSDEALRLASLLTMDRVIFNEFLNASNDIRDWVELRNISGTDVDFTDWELHVITADANTTINFPDGFMLPAGELLLFLNTDPSHPDMLLASPSRYLVDELLVLPEDDFTLVLRSPEAFEDSVGNYFFGFEKPSTALTLTDDIAWYRHRPSDIGFHAEAWIESGYRSGRGYDPGLPAGITLGSPGFSHRPTGDVNDDGITNIVDLVLTASQMGETGEVDGDVNGDGVVNIQDLVIIANELTDIPSAPSAKTLHASQVQQWLTLAKQRSIELTPSAYEQGIRNLEQLLATLVPQSSVLLANYPNPFNPETWIPYRLAKPSDVQVNIYDARGSVVRQLDLGHQSAGIYQSRSRAAYWDGTNDVGESVASGIYFYTLTAGDFSATRKMLILK